MDSSLFVAIIAGLGGMLGWGLADFFAKKTIDQIGDVLTLVWAHVFGAILLLVAFLYQFIAHRQDIELPHTPTDWSLLLLFGALQAIVYLLVYKGFGKGQLALLNPVFSSFSGLTAILSIVVFGEILTGSILLALITIFLGILLLSIDIHALRSRRIAFARLPGLREVASATVLAAVWTISWDRFVSGRDWLSYALIMYIFMTLVMIAVAKIQRIKLSVNKSNCWKFLFLIGLSETIAYLAISFGYSTTSQTSIIALLSGAFSLPTIILARIFLKEKTTRLQLIGTLVIIVGIMFISIV